MQMHLGEPSKNVFFRILPEVQIFYLAANYLAVTIPSGSWHCYHVGCTGELYLPCKLFYAIASLQSSLLPAVLLFLTGTSCFSLSLDLVCQNMCDVRPHNNVLSACCVIKYQCIWLLVSLTKKKKKNTLY